jgi:nucleoid-associated protein YgaU
MSNVLQVIRFALGLTMVAAGGLLAAPFVSAVMDSARESAGSQSQIGPPRQTAALQSAGVFAVPGTSGHALSGHTNKPLHRELPQPPEAMSMSPPKLLPPVQQAGPPPGLHSAYRSTVQMPPPPLLDPAAPSPARLNHGLKPLPTAVSRPDDVPVPDVYRVQDGDDLTAIATRLYGHPRGASVLWQANADRLESPDLLPIGMPLKVPPAWQVFQGDRAFAGRPQQIEPRHGQHQVVPAGGVSVGGQPGVATVSHQSDQAVRPWLGKAPTVSTMASVQPATLVGRGSLRVAAGETLESIAQRVYGDPQMAAALFAANSDRLRSPELLVPGMELRLP